ncbi:MAG: hypothetical protein J7497_08170 [Chitinophagaceae bacterium]|nr:hypothetical protein [Chitinophagaceae bacterium]
MDNKQKGLVDDNREGFILNESGTSVKTDDNEKQENVKAEEGSKSDPQLTEFDGLLKGGVEPHVHTEDLPDKKENPEQGR